MKNNTPLFKNGETVLFNGQSVVVGNVRNEGETADLTCELFPGMPVQFMGINYTSVSHL